MLYMYVIHAACRPDYLPNIHRQSGLKCHPQRATIIENKYTLLVIYPRRRFLQCQISTISVEIYMHYNNVGLSKPWTLLLNTITLLCLVRTERVATVLIKQGTCKIYCTRMHIYVFSFK